MNDLLQMKNLEILNTVGQWKVIPMQKLEEHMQIKMSYSAIRKRVSKLEQRDLLNVEVGDNKRKLLSLTQRGLMLSSDGALSTHKDHDLIVSNVLMGLSEFEGFKRCQTKALDVSLDPDGVIFGEKDGKEYTIALEVELNQKSRKRLEDKICRFNQSKHYDYMMYVFNSRPIFRSYVDKIKCDRVIFMFAPIVSVFDYNKTQIVFRDKEMSFKQMYQSSRNRD